MIASQLISHSVPPLKTSDTGQKAMHFMNVLHVRHLPIVNNEQFLGLLSEEDVLNFNSPEEPIGGHSLSLLRPFVHEDEHLYEVIKMAVTKQLTVVPVVDADDDYLGVITLEDLLKYFAQTGSLVDPGTILVLEMQKRDYSLAEIARIVESESASVLSTYVTSLPESSLMEVTLKLNSQAIKHIVATFERFGYKIKASFQESDYMDSLKERYDALMNYLNV
ncbi:MAG: CBS domain-containing protein [Bacteroidota bacterium]